jgi:type III secretion system FlhB-like substrate exporter
MAAALQALALDAEIPPALYRAVAATLDWASDLDERLRRGDQLRHQSS